MVVGNARERKWIPEVLVVVLVVKLLALVLSVLYKRDIFIG